MNKLKPIKTIAGQILLYFYFLHRNNPSILSCWTMAFNMIRKTVENNQINDEVSETLFKISPNQVDIINALEYLSNKGFVEFGSDTFDLGGNGTFYDTKITASGIDIIEDIEQKNTSSRNKFEVNFNITLNNVMNIESLIKTEIGSLLKGSLVGL